jgi:hypothetical protein
MKEPKEKSIQRSKHYHRKTHMGNRLNRGSTVWNLGRGKVNENDRTSAISHNIKCEGRAYKVVY